MRTLLLVFPIMLLLVACSPHDPVRVRRADVEVGDTRISVGDGHSGNGDFCPPGQAKKNRC
jgi:hypothetical protein